MFVYHIFFKTKTIKKNSNNRIILIYVRKKRVSYPKGTTSKICRKNIGDIRETRSNINLYSFII